MSQCQEEEKEEEEEEEEENLQRAHSQALSINRTSRSPLGGGAAITTCPSILTQNKSVLALGCTCIHCTPWLRL